MSKSKQKPKIQLDVKSLKELREKWAKEQDNICPILQIDMEDKAILDHYHANKSDNSDIDYFKGCVRGVIHSRVNAFEGKLSNALIRVGLRDLIDLPTLLRNLADYYEYNRLHSEDVLYIHPSEKPKEPILTKSSYNELQKVLSEKDLKKLPLYKAKKQKLTKVLQELFEKYNLEPQFYK